MEGQTRPGREGLVKAATRLFAERGVAATSLQQIGMAAGVTKAAVYHHFGSQEEVLEAVLAPAIDATAAMVRTAQAMRDPVSRVDAVIVALADQAVQHRDLWAVLLGDPTVMRLLRHDERFVGLFASLQELLVGPDPDQYRRLATAVFLSGLMGPPADPRCAGLDDEALRNGIIEAGRRLLASAPTESTLPTQSNSGSLQSPGDSQHPQTRSRSDAQNSATTT